MSTRSFFLWSVLVLALLAGCRPRKAAPDAASSGPTLTPQQKHIVNLNQEIAEMTGPRGCAKSAECKVIGVGYNRCGGPRQHIVYCPKGVDEAKLQSKVAELLKLEEDEAKLQGEPPPCRSVPAPQAEAVDNVCRAKL